MSSADRGFVSMAKTALVTGGNRGIGQQVARVLATEGWDVLVAARDRGKADAAAARLRKDTGGRLRGVELDVTSDDSVAICAQKLRDGAIRIDALVNNAGIYRGSADEILETDFFGPLRVTLGLLPLVHDGATITNVTSGLASGMRLDPSPTREALVAQVKKLAPRGDAYSLAKAALNALTRLFAVELAPRQIRVNACDPGWVRTDMGGRGAPRSVEQGAASVLYGVTAPGTGGVFRDGRPI
jgi:NAD(P)-dependent dehydrogenase (short-subunit alcohol dehydrogenase family)